MHLLCDHKHDVCRSRHRRCIMSGREAFKRVKPRNSRKDKRVWTGRLQRRRNARCALRTCPACKRLHHAYASAQRASETSGRYIYCKGTLTTCAVTSEYVRNADNLLTALQLLTEQNEKQYQVIYSVRDRLIALEAEVDELKGARQQGWFKRGQRAQAADDHGDARHDKLD